jgi:hypothetical protein
MNGRTDGRKGRSSPAPQGSGTRPRLLGKLSGWHRCGDLAVSTAAAGPSRRGG